MSIIVVSGLATGVGKTTATAALVHILHMRGRDVLPVKVARLGHTRSFDVGTIEKLTGIIGADFSTETNPLAVVEELSARGKTVVVEGSGGLHVPLVKDATIAHIAAQLAAPMVVVSGMDPSAVSVATEAVQFAHACGAKVAGLIGGKLPDDADLRTRLILMQVARETNVPFLGSLRDGIGQLGKDAFAAATETIFLPQHW